MPLLRCQCCGHEQDFQDPEDAFRVGWDAPPHFPYVACPVCPGVCVLGMATHEKAHAHWAEHGRPATFDLATCATDDEFGDEEMVRQAQSGVDRLMAIAETAKGGAPHGLTLTDEERALAKLLASLSELSPRKEN